MPVSLLIAVQPFRNVPRQYYTTEESLQEKPISVAVVERTSGRHLSHDF